MSKNLVKEAIAELEQVINERYLTPAMKLALQGLENGKALTSAISFCKSAINSDPSADRFELVTSVAEKSGVDFDALFKVIEKYQPVQNEATSGAMERWLRNNKKKFKVKYGKDWERIWYAVAWEMFQK